MTEAEILARGYSSYRGGYKWKSYRQASFNQEKQITTDGSFVMIYWEKLEATDYFAIPMLIKRFELKKSFSIFKFIRKMWQTINPSSMRSISKQVYQVVIETFYKQFQQSMANPTLVSINLAHDTEIDFKFKLGLTFAEFYDIIFDITDTLAKSMLVSEYIRLIHTTTNLVLESSGFIGLNLHAKLHLNENVRPMYHAWMQQHLRDLTPGNQSTENLNDTTKLSVSKTSIHLPELFKIASNQLAPKFLNRSKPKIYRDKSLTKWTMAKAIDEGRKSKSPVRHISPVVEKKISKKTFFKLETQKKNPLSIVPRKDFKNTYVLENIIEERTGKLLREKFE